MGTKVVKESQKTAKKQALNEKMNTRDGLSVYGYIRQNFERKCLIQEIIAIIIKFYKNKGGFLYICGNTEYLRIVNNETSEFSECRKPTRVQSAKDIVDIAGGDLHTMMVDYYGKVLAFGYGRDGQLGTGISGRRAETNWQVPKQINLNQRAIAVSVGYKHSLILVDNGNVSSCGGNRFGQLGHGDAETQLIPKIIEALKVHRIIQISAGYFHSGALSEKGDLFMWGSNRYGQCGVDQHKTHAILAPKKVKIKGKVSVIECGIYHTLLITMSNLLYSFGYNSHGQSGDGTACPNHYAHDMQKRHVPTLIVALKDVKILDVAGGRNHTLCVDDKLNVWAFGSNEEGQCGQSKSIQCQLIPKKIEYFSTNKIKATEVSASQFSSCVISQNNECFVFGKNNHRQIGLEDKTDHFVPTKLPLFVQKASMGSYHSTFIRG